MTDAVMKTEVLPVDARKIGSLQAVPQPGDLLDRFKMQLDENSLDAHALRRAAEQLKSSAIPVAFPTETVYGLGADATRSDAVLGIYKAKQRPADNPLIVHFASLQQLRRHLRPEPNGLVVNGDVSAPVADDPIPGIYHPLIKCFWPGPSTIVLPNPSPSTLAPEVTAGLTTFGARMPGNLLALALIKLADVPVAAPSANASTKPSPTAAEHVAYDLEGRIETIIDGGPCTVGVESTVVDGLSDPPLILRPGGISMEQLRACPGWERVQIGYKNTAEIGSQPRAPGMKYRHYSPKAPVVLFEAGTGPPTNAELRQYVGSSSKIGIVSTRGWAIGPDNASTAIGLQAETGVSAPTARTMDGDTRRLGFAGLLETLDSPQASPDAIRRHTISCDEMKVQLLEVPLGPDTPSIARGIFAALRELDREDVDAIVVEGIHDEEGETAAAVMNRLRKAAEVKVAG